MNMRVAKEEIALLMPASLSHYADEPRLFVETIRKGFLASIVSALRFLVELPNRHAVMLELNDMSDRELADIGLHRAELGRVFDPNFVASRRPLGGVALDA
jgi:uncharacterized protein YjiS (DUF1127 family)